jgi:hypothetical protein
VQIIAKRNIELSAEGDIRMKAKGDIIMQSNNTSIRSEEQVVLNSGTGRFTLRDDVLETNTTITGKEFTGFLPGAMPGPGAQEDTSAGLEASIIKDILPITQEQREPKDRGVTENDPFDAVKNTVIAPPVAIEEDEKPT